MAKSKSSKQASNRFEIGSQGGCEALLFEFRDRRSVELSEAVEQPPETHIARIAAVTLDEALAYLHWDEPDFVIESIQNVGLIVMVSGSPLD
jgi:hypothetical protein